MSKFAQIKKGREIENSLAGFPVFYSNEKHKVVTANPWSYLQNYIYENLTESTAKRVEAFLNQSYEFFEAAKNPNLGSRPLLFYYSFLNLIKSFLIIKKVDLPIAAKHGMNDPRINNKTRLRFESQIVRLEKLAADKSQLMPEFIKALGGDAGKPIDKKLIDLFYHVPAIHRTYLNVTNRKSIFLPIKKIKIFNDSDSNVWYRIILDKHDTDVIDCLSKFKNKLKSCNIKLTQTNCPNEDERWFESRNYNNGRRWTQKAIAQAAEDLCNLGIYTILTNQGYRLYFNVDKGPVFPQLSISLAIIFYLGSITRYKPLDYKKIIYGKYGLLINEFLSTQPTQFLYILLSYIKGTYVVRPYATFE